jgi:hypothetical protein
MVALLRLLPRNGGVAGGGMNTGDMGVISIHEHDRTARRLSDRVVENRGLAGR